MPSRSSAPWRARASTASSCAPVAASRPRASARSRKSISSSGKSSVASTSMRSSISASASASISLRERAVERARGRARRRFGAGVDQVGDGFGLGQVELVVEEGALGEFARPGDAQARRARPVRRRIDRGGGLEAAREQQLQHDRAAVRLQLEHVFAGVRVRRREVERQALIDRPRRRASRNGR